MISQSEPSKIAWIYVGNFLCTISLWIQSCKEIFSLNLPTFLSILVQKSSTWKHKISNFWIEFDQKKTPTNFYVKCKYFISNLIPFSEPVYRSCLPSTMETVDRDWCWSNLYILFSKCLYYWYIIAVPIFFFNNDAVYIFVLRL